MGEKHLDTSTLTAASSKIDVFGIVLPSEELIKMDGRPIIMHEWSPSFDRRGVCDKLPITCSRT